MSLMAAVSDQSCTRIGGSPRDVVWLTGVTTFDRMGWIGQVAIAGKLTAGRSPDGEFVPVSCSGPRLTAHCRSARARGRVTGG